MTTNAHGMIYDSAKLTPKFRFIVRVRFEAYIYSIFRRKEIVLLYVQDLILSSNARDHDVVTFIWVYDVFFPHSDHRITTNDTRNVKSI